MEWIASHIETTPIGAELVLGVLITYGIVGAQIIDDGEMRRFFADNPLQWDYVDESLLDTSTDRAEVSVLFYVSNNPDGRQTLHAIGTRLDALLAQHTDLPLGSLCLSSDTVDDEHWLHEWKKYYKPFRIGSRVVVRPFWEPYTAAPDDVVFTIDPGAVFGTGLHATTQLCVEALEKVVRPGDTLLDIGCGSGILLLIALLLGAEYGFGCDFDTAAAATVQANAALNQIDASRYTVRTGNIFTDDGLLNELGSYHLIVANIAADTILGLLPFVGRFLRPGGCFVASGIITERCDEVLSAAATHGWQSIGDAACLDGWHACLLRRA